MLDQQVSNVFSFCDFECFCTFPLPFSLTTLTSSKSSSVDIDCAQPRLLCVRQGNWGPRGHIAALLSEQVRADVPRCLRARAPTEPRERGGHRVQVWPALLRGMRDFWGWRVHGAVHALPHGVARAMQAERYPAALAQVPTLLAARARDTVGLILESGCFCALNFDSG